MFTNGKQCVNAQNICDQKTLTCITKYIFKIELKKKMYYDFYNYYLSYSIKTNDFAFYRILI